MQDSWQVAPSEIFSDQYKRQSEGWVQSRQCIEQAFERNGPFHGILGYSQAGSEVFLSSILPAGLSLSGPLAEDSESHSITVSSLS